MWKAPTTRSTSFSRTSYRFAESALMRCDAKVPVLPRDSDHGEATRL